MGEGPPMCNILPGEPIGCLAWSANDNRIHDWKKGVTSEAAGRGEGLAPEVWGACSKQLPWLMCLAVVGTMLVSALPALGLCAEQEEQACAHHCHW